MRCSYLCVMAGLPAVEGMQKLLRDNGDKLVFDAQEKVFKLKSATK